MAAKRRPEGSSPESEPAWKLKERIVRLLEETLDPSAVVEHDVRLPELVGGAKRQCDVLITYRHGPRETRAIVEVQKRASRVTLPTFEGWCRKREKLGVQHLLCVSAKGFSNSVVEEAKRLGPTVRLLTLKELTREELGRRLPSVSLRLLWTVPVSVKATIQTEGTGSGPAPAALATAEGESVSLAGIGGEIHQRIALRYAEEMPPTSQRKTYREIYKPATPLMATGPEGTGPVREIIFDLEVECESHLLSILLTAYEQIDYEGILAWAGHAHATVGGREIQFRVIWLPDERGLPAGIGPMEVSGIPEGAIFQVLLSIV